MSPAGRENSEVSDSLGLWRAGLAARLPVLASAWGRWRGNASFMERFSSSTRTAIFTKTLRTVAKVAPRQRDRLGAAIRTECRSQHAPMRRNRRNWLACRREHAVLSERVLSFMSLIRFSMHPRAQ